MLAEPSELCTAPIIREFACGTTCSEHRLEAMHVSLAFMSPILKSLMSTEPKRRSRQSSPGIIHTNEFCTATSHGEFTSETLGPEHSLEFLQVSIACATPSDEQPSTNEFCIATSTGEFVADMTGLKHCMDDCKHGLKPMQIKQKKKYNMWRDELQDDGVCQQQ